MLVSPHRPVLNWKAVHIDQDQLHTCVRESFLETHTCGRETELRSERQLGFLLAAIIDRIALETDVDQWWWRRGAPKLT